MEAARAPRLTCLGATALLLAFLSSLLPAASPVAEWNPDPKTIPDAQRFGLEGSSEALDTILARDLPDSDQEQWRNVTGQEGDVFVDNQAGKETEDHQSSKKPPVDAPDLAPAVGTAASTDISTDGGSSFSLAGSTLRYYPSGIDNESSESSVCLGCPGEIANERLQPDTKTLLVKHNEGALEGAGVLGSMAVPTVQESFDREIGDTKETAERQEDMGSGDQHLKPPAVVATFPSSMEKKWDMETFLGSTISTLLPSSSTIARGTDMASEPREKTISPDSAETDHLLQVFHEGVLHSPTPSEKPADPNPKRVPKPEISLEPETEQHVPPETWIETISSPPTQGSTDLTLSHKEMESWDDNTPPPTILKPPEPPFKQSLAEIIDADYYDLSDLESHGDLENFPDGDSTKTAQDKKKSSWATSDLYNDFITFDESDFYPTTSFYTDGDEEGGAEEDEDEDMEVEDGIIRELENEDDSKLKTFTPKIQITVRNEKPTGVQQVPQQTFVTFQNELNPKSYPETVKEPTQTLTGSSNSSTECKNGYLRHNRTCKSVCDIYPTYCYNGGQCYLVENSGAFCRCNTQDYIWHKGVRCESIITDFQVMCVAVGTAALVVLLLFMMTVFFAKKLYLLKTENYKLRKRNRYRTPSELHNDNFSLSTIAEGSHPNEDPNAPHKLQDPTKPFVKEEEPFNIQNALSPKHDSDKSGQDSLEVNYLQNNLT